MGDRYPNEPGAKGPDGTSQGAVEELKPNVSHPRRLTPHGEATTLEVVAATGFAREALQRSLSELRARGLVVPTSAQPRNPSGKNAAVPRLNDKGRAVL